MGWWGGGRKVSKMLFLVFSFLKRKKKGVISLKTLVYEVKVKIHRNKTDME